MIKSVDRKCGGVHVISLPTKLPQAKLAECRRQQSATKQKSCHISPQTITAIIIKFGNLTKREQVRLFLHLNSFAEEQLPVKKSLYVFTISLSHRPGGRGKVKS